MGLFVAPLVKCPESTSPEWLLRFQGGAMLFSGFSRGLKCTQCGHTYGDVTPTSVVPILMVAFLGGITWYKLLVTLGWMRVLAFFVAWILAFLFPYLLLVVLFEIPKSYYLRKCWQ